MRTVGWVLFTIGALGILGFFSLLFEARLELRGLVGSLVFTGVGLALIRFGEKSPQQIARRELGAEPAKAKPEPASKIVLKLAKKHQGRITANEVAAESPLTLEAAKKQLEQLVTQGDCRMEVSQSGVVVYHFPEFESAKAKKDLL
jgi:hypothetical protein